MIDADGLSLLAIGLAILAGAFALLCYWLKYEYRENKEISLLPTKPKTESITRWEDFDIMRAGK